MEAQTVCPGKYIAIITGDLSAVKAAVDTAVTTYEDKCIDSFVLGNPHESIFPAIYGTTQVEEDVYKRQESGGPDNIAVTVEKPTLETSNIMMKHKDIHLIAATGGPGVVTCLLYTSRCV